MEPNRTEPKRIEPGSGEPGPARPGPVHLIGSNETVMGKPTENKNVAPAPAPAQIVEPAPAPVVVAPALLPEPAPAQIVIASPADLAAFLKQHNANLSPSAIAPVYAGGRGSGDALLSRVITVLIPYNPKSGASRGRFELYKNGMTVAQYIALGGRRGDIAWDTAATRNYIKLD